MPRFTSTLLALLGTAATSSLACVIPTEPLSNTITTFFSIRTQNPAIPRVHNYIMNFVANGDDEHLVLRPAGIRTYDSLWLDNGLLRTRNIRAVIDLEVIVLLVKLVSLVLCREVFRMVLISKTVRRQR